MKAWIAALVFMFPLGTCAQDGIMISGDSMMYSVPDYGSVMLAQSAMSSAFEKNPGNPNTRNPHTTGSAKRVPTGNNTAQAPSEFRYDAKISSQIQSEYLAGLEKRVGKPAANVFSTYFGKHPVRQQFDIAAGPYGLRDDDLVDVVTAYFAVMWMTANQSALPSRSQVSGLRAQMRRVLPDSGKIPATAAGRQRLAESLMYKLVSMILLAEEAKASGNQNVLQQLSVVAQRDAGKGFDLKATLLTAKGFEQH